MSKRRNYKTPDFLDGIAKTQWKSRIKQLSERGDIKAEDLTNLEIYCEPRYAIKKPSIVRESRCRKSHDQDVIIARFRPCKPQKKSY